MPQRSLHRSAHHGRADLGTQQQMVQMNVIALMTLARHFGAAMAERGRGAILFVCSLSGWMPQPLMAQA